MIFNFIDLFTLTDALAFLSDFFPRFFPFSFLFQIAVNSHDSSDSISFVQSCQAMSIPYRLVYAFRMVKIYEFYDPDNAYLLIVK